MPRALFESKNLIGDALAIQPALYRWAQEHQGWEIDLYTLPDHVAVLYEGMGVPLRVLTREEDLQKPYDFEFRFDVGQAFSLGQQSGLHIIEAYLTMLVGEEVRLKREEKRSAYVPAILPTEREQVEEGLVMLSPFSRSCASNEGKPPNKMLPWAHWWPVVPLLRQLGGKLVVLGGPKDRAPLPLSEDEYYTGLPLPLVAEMMRHAKLLVTIDNGMAHLGASQRVPMIEFYPACLSVNWIAPVGNPHLVLAQVDPAQLAPGSAAFLVRKGIEELRRQGVLK